MSNINTARYRFKTEQEFKKGGLWDTRCAAPKGWATSKSMNKYLGQEIPEDYNDYCEANRNFIGPESWTFQSSDYVPIAKENLIGRYIKYAKYNPGTSSSGYEKIVEDTPGKDTIELEYYGSTARSRLTDRDFELMALGFTPSSADSSIPILKQDLAGRWIKWNVETTRRSLNYKIGDYSQIERIDFDENDVYLHGNISHFTNARLVDGDWELMPIDFIPPINTLPEKWCVKVEGPSTEPRYAELASWRPNPWKNPGYIHSDLYHDLSIRRGYIEITLEDFKKLVYKKEDLPTPQSKGSAYSEYVSKEGDTITIGKIKTLVYYNKHEGYWLDNPGGAISAIYEQFGLKKDQLRDFLGYSSNGSFPYCKTIDDLNRVIGFIKAKEASSFVMTDTTTAGDFASSVNRNLAILCSSKQQVKSIFDKLKALGEQKDPINLTYTPQWCYIIYSNKGNYNGWYLALSGELGERTVIDGDKFLGPSPSTATESSPATSSLPSFPAEGCYELSDPGVQELLSLLQDTRPSPVSRNTYDVMVAWNARSYWYVSTMSGKRKYTYANLRPFLDTQSGESSSPKIDSSSSDTPKFIVGKWYGTDSWGNDSFVKFESVSSSYNDRVYFTESIYNGTYRKKGSDWWGSAQSMKEADMEIVSKYLPIGHPDKIVSGTPTVDLLEEAKKRYPIGTKGNNRNLGIGYDFEITGTNFEFDPDYNIRAKSDSTSIGSTRTVYKKGEWAEITHTPLSDSVFPEYVEALESSGNGYTKGKIYKTTNRSSDIREGKVFTINPNAEAVADFILNCNFVPYYKEHKFIQAVNAVYKRLNKEQLQKIKTNLIAIPQFAKASDYIMAFENILNKGKIPANRIKLS